MATVEEVLNDMSTADVIGSAANIEYLIDNELRIITVPQNGVVLGVEGDKDVNVVHFKMPRMYRGLDLGDGFNIRVNYANAKAELGYFAVVRPNVTEDSISFEWLLGSHALMYVGEIKFAVSLIKSSVDGRIEKKFNTTLGKAQCLTGLYVDVSVPEEDIYDLLTQIKQDVMADIQPSLDGAKADAAAAKQSATQAAESAATASTGAENVRLGVEAVKDAVKIAEQTSAHVDEVKTVVEASATAASSDAAKAEAAKTAAVTAQGKAEAAKTSAEQFKMAAEQAKDDATAQAQAAAQSSEAAEQAKTEASESKTAAAQSAEAAEQAKTEASTSKTAAAESAKQAKVSQDAASTSAQTASTKAEEAKTSADAAKVSETNAKASENAATSIVENAKVVSENVLKGEETATLINVTDAWPSKLRGMKIYGQSNQLTTTGKNLLGGERSVSGYNIRGFKNILKPNTQYTYSSSGITDGKAAFKLLAFNAEQSKEIGLTVGYIKNASETFTTPENIGEFEELYLGGNYNDAGKNCINSHFQIEEGAKATAYEPYTGGKPSPSLEYPQEITNLNKAELVITGKNLINPNRLAQIDSSCYQAVDGQLKVINSHNTAWKYVPIYGTLQAGTYTLSGDNIEIRDTALNQIVNIMSTQVKQFTLNNPTAIKMKIGYGLPKYPVITKAQLEVGSKATAYEPHKSKNTVIDLKGNELCSLPNGVKDEVVIDAEGNVSLIKRTKQYDWNCAQVIKGTGHNYAVDKVLDIGANYTGLVAEKAINATNNNTIGICYVNQKMIYVTVPESVTTKEQGNQLYGGMKVIYQLAEPQTIPLDKVELPALPESTSNVWNDGNIPANVYINYLKDVNIAYSDLENQIKQIATALSVTTLEIATK